MTIKNLSICKVKPLDILAFVLVSPSAKGETPHVTVVSLSAKRETPHVMWFVGDTRAHVTPRVC
jgi:hypothetical protein